MAIKKSFTIAGENATSLNKTDVSKKEKNRNVQWLVLALIGIIFLLLIILIVVLKKKKMIRFNKFVRQLIVCNFIRKRSTISAPFSYKSVPASKKLTFHLYYWIENEKLDKRNINFLKAGTCFS